MNKLGRNLCLVEVPALEEDLKFARLSLLEYSHHPRTKIDSFASQFTFLCIEYNGLFLVKWGSHLTVLAWSSYIHHVQMFAVLMYFNFSLPFEKMFISKT